MANNRAALMGSAISFAHLLGNSSAGRRARRADDDDQNDPNAEDSDDNDGDSGSGNTTGARRADNDPDDTDPDAEDDDEDDDSPSARRARKARGDDDDVDPDAEDDEDDPKARSARRRERARCAAIFGCSAAGSRPDLAAHLAFNTSLPRREAVSLLKAAARGKGNSGSSLSDRMAAHGDHPVTGTAPPRQTGRQAVGSSWDAASARAGIKTR